MPDVITRLSHFRVDPPHPLDSQQLSFSLSSSPPFFTSHSVLLFCAKRRETHLSPLHLHSISSGPAHSACAILGKRTDWIQGGKRRSVPGDREVP